MIWAHCDVVRSGFTEEACFGWLFLDRKNMHLRPYNFQSKADFIALFSFLLTLICIFSLGAVRKFDRQITETIVGEATVARFMEAESLFYEFWIDRLPNKPDSI